MKRRRLENGLRIIVDEDHRAPVAAAQIWVQVGSADEGPGEEGLAHVHEHMLFKGTARRGVGDIAKEVESCGGYMNAFTGYDETVYYITIQSDEWQLAIDILADVVQNAAFDPDELARELDVVLEELRQRQDEPQITLFEGLYGKAFQKHPYCRPIIGSVESVSAFNREGILRFYERHYAPDNMVLVVTGDVEAEAVFALAERLFVKPASQKTRPERLSEPPQEATRALSLSEDIELSYLGLAFQGVSIRDADAPALELLLAALGDGESSRLRQRLVREAQLAQSTGAWLDAPRDPGLILFHADTTHEDPQQLLRGLLEEMRRLQEAPVSEEELQKLKRAVRAGTLMSRSTVEGMARRLGYYELMAGDAAFAEEDEARLLKQSQADLLRVAKRYLKPSALTVAGVFPKAKADAMSEAALLETVASVWGEGVRPRTKDQPKDRPRDRGTSKTPASGPRLIPLEAGPTLLVLEDKRLPMVFAKAGVLGGALLESDEEAGLSLLVGKMLGRGSAKYSAEAIIQKVENIAGAMSGGASRSELGLSCRFMTESWDEGLDLFLDSLLAPSFPKAEFLREQALLLAAIRQQAESPSVVLSEQLARGLFGEHPMARPVTGTEAGVRALGQDAPIEPLLAGIYERQLAWDRLIFAIAGDFDLETTQAAIETALAKASRPNTPPAVFPATPTPPKARLRLSTEMDRKQAYLQIGFLGVLRKDPRWAPLYLLSLILGGQGGRLFLDLRDKQSLAYSVGASSNSGFMAGSFSVDMITQPKKLEAAEAGLRVHLDRIRQAPVSETELAHAKRYAMGAKAIREQRVAARLSSMMRYELIGLGHLETERVRAELEAVTTADILSAAQTILQPEQEVLSLVIPGAETAEA